MGTGVKTVQLQGSVFVLGLLLIFLPKQDQRDIMQNLWELLIFQEECPMKIEQVLFHRFFFQNYGIRVSEGHFYYVHTIRVLEPTKSDPIVRMNHILGDDCIHTVDQGRFINKNVKW